MSNSSDNAEMGGGAAYDATAPVPYWHQNMELATICVANSLTLVIIIARLWVRRVKLKRFKADDLWIVAAGALLIFPHWVCQIGTNRYGSGLHAYNVPDSWLVPYWRFSWGWAGYYIVCSLIKVSMCCCLLEILPYPFQTLRWLVYALCVAILLLGFALANIWLFQCRPFLSNFIYTIESSWCMNIEAARLSWVGLSVLIDLVIIAIPFAIIKRAALKPFERMALMLVFGASLLGTITCLIGICGIWFNRNSQAFVDLTYTDTLFVMLNDIEILMYTLGASATVASKYIISKVAAFASYTSSVRSRSASKGQELPSWRRRTGTWAAIHETDLGNNPSHFPVTREVCVNHDPEWIGGVSPQNSDFKDRSIEEEGAAPSVSEAKGSIFQNVDTTKAIVP